MPSTEAPTGQPPPVKKREIFGWAMYDFANSSYTTVVITVIYSAFFVEQIVPPGSEARDTYWSIAIAASAVLALLLSPLVGAICDYGGGKKRYLAVTTLFCAGATMALYLVDPGGVWPAVALITISNAAFMIGEAFCGSFLTDLATKKTMGMISGLGWGLGYFGGLASLVLVLGTITVEPSEDLATHVAQNQLAMVLIGAFFLLAALPTFLLVRERSKPAPGFEGASYLRLARAGLAETASTFRLARQYPVLFKFFLAFTVYMAGLEVVMKFVGIYATDELAMTQGDLTVMFIIIQISAASGALGFGLLERKLGAKATVMATIIWWMVGILGIYFLQALADLTGLTLVQVFFGVSLIAGAGIGSIQSSSRTVVGLLSPAERSAQMFGFWGMFGKIAIILGMAFGPVSDLFGRREAMLLVLGFFAVGGLLLWRVPISDGIRAAEEADEAAKRAAG
ncbi:MAG: MFS transporter [Myxococcales bacterium]|nr:MFS transporter [Myxococcales bacterium]